ncbi:MAG: hypothetical protein IPM01_27930 [Burkholderiaceae bacterium]|nr:hypothetical protein [Burkholderiaceae bacterium]
MTDEPSTLEPAIQDLRETLSDFRLAPYQTADRILTRLAYQFEEEPLAGFLGSVLPQVDASAWYERALASIGTMSGSGVLDWPASRPQRVAIQVWLCRGIASGRIPLLDFAFKFLGPGSGLTAKIDAFSGVVLEPLVRDIERLKETRPVPPILFEAMGHLPTSGDATLDSLLNDACAKFKDPAPKARAEATQTLWHAWERLKSIEVQGNKKQSVGRLLDLAAPEPAFRAQLESEAHALTDIGNNFHIRHFETDSVALALPAHFDYLFHRLYALIHFLLFSRAKR